MNATIKEIALPNKTETFEFGAIAKQANGSVLYRCGKSVLLASVCYESDERVKEDFLPLTVQYIEKSYAAGKFPGGFIKRESKPGDFETLTSRIIDRSLRPLFPKGYAHPTQITVMVLSAQNDADLQTMALNAASAALFVSDIPLRKPVHGLRIGKINGALVVNPTTKEMSESTLDLFVSGVEEDLLMIEMRTLASDEINNTCFVGDCGMVAASASDILKIHQANEMKEEELLEALELAKTSIKKASACYVEAFTPLAKPDAILELKPDITSSEIYQYIKENHAIAIKEAITRMAKSERHSDLKRIAKEIASSERAQESEWSFEAVYETVGKYKREAVRALILEERRRADGRGLKEVRPIDIQTNILPNAHASALFTRGETQALVVATLGGDMDAQSYELLTEKGSSKERFMVHYNFPSFSVGEAGMVGAPGRRELGHGNLAKRALEPTIEEWGAQTIRLVSEILESNGSSSMATVCGGSLALKAAGINTTALVAGVAMGLIVEAEKHAILTDIMGLEDHDGDMDFKIAGTSTGITAMQMDIKLGGLSMEILKEALYQAKEGREHILGIMEKAQSEIIINDEILPSLQIFSINPGRIVDIIGQAGKTIKEIIERFEVAIDLNRDNGEVKVTGSNKQKVEAAKEHILSISNQEAPQRVRVADVYSAGEVFKGKVKKIVDFGAFIELPKGGDGLLHVSKIVQHRDQRIDEVIKEGEEIEVQILSINKNKVELGRATRPN
ncbi:polyribonucleotide nucleotidyltransferase [Wolinella succinogenes]|uniref:Polyribonucleotide nucleotidyltransferase n=1 Tax=Wolinella succinogenes (strain ATCC 29543 / DSM 1740 / CCUG 13145 / JCM 31913 / LMG 7466 / NCTC 11488 / FDC 602W) TaxID=273121 RepID=PNP_WOLSU|nr:polyribonucleotide nucleotidyltransferase [Wolinella succinogenes]Q7M9I4.1 RecName: Full=Polyribonucleotide nucleotidyltransferase; AltName: Full=Polynucleotide phosphorylase; Short=PNPase [Wolinella succinogenes DSM 1740]CAE10004.1 NUCLEOTIDYLTRANSFERASE [Wolinella succinogenes]VEG82216.1 Polyribonucleotide nucleotidyltransferase [Wolinella succinogenes]